MVPLPLPPEAESEFVREDGVIGRRGSELGAGRSTSSNLLPLPWSAEAGADLGAGGEEVRGGDGRGQVQVGGRGRVEGAQGEGQGLPPLPQLVGVGMASTYQRTQAV